MLAAWLILGNPLPEKNPPPMIDRLYDLDNLVSTAGVFVVVSSAAYLVGSLASGLGSAAVAFAQKHLNISRNRPRGLRRAIARWIRNSDYKDRWLSPRVERRLERWVQDQLRHARARAGFRGGDTGLHQGAEPPTGTGGNGGVDGGGGVGSNAWSLYATVLDEMDQTKLRLLSENPGLFNEIDRAAAEADFRFAIAPPLLVLCLLLSYGHSLWWLMGVPVVFGIVADGVRQRRYAEDSLATAIVVGSVTPPTIDEINANRRRLSGAS